MKLKNNIIESEKSNIVIKAKNFFLVSDGSLPGTYIEINGKKAELIQNLTINWDIKNSIPTINMTSSLVPEKQNDKEDLSKIARAFKEDQEIFDITEPILDFEEKYIFGHWIIYKRTGQKCYTFILTDRFHYWKKGGNLISIADSVKYQSVTTKYLIDILGPIFKDCGIPLAKFEPSKNIETLYQNRTFDLFSEDLKIYRPLIYTFPEYGFLCTNTIKIFHDLPNTIYTDEDIPNEVFFKDKFNKKLSNEINSYLGSKNDLYLDSITLIPMRYNNEYAFDISYVNPSSSYWPGFFDDTSSLLENNLNLNETQKNILSQEYLRFLNRIL